MATATLSDVAVLLGLVEADLDRAARSGAVFSHPASAYMRAWESLRHSGTGMQLPGVLAREPGYLAAIGARFGAVERAGDVPELLLRAALARLDLLLHTRHGWDAPTAAPSHEGAWEALQPC